MKSPYRSAGKICGLLFVLMLMCSQTNRATGEEKPTAGSPPATKLIRVGVFPLEPLNYIDMEGRATGLFPDLLREIFRDAPWAIEFTPCNWSQCLNKLQSGEIDLMTTIAYTPERAEAMDYSKVPVVDIWGQVFVFPGSNINNFKDLEAKRVGIMRRDVNGANFLKTARGLDVKPIIVEYSTHDEIFEAIMQHRIAAGVAPQHFGSLKAREYGVVGSSMVFSPFSVYFAVKKGNNLDFLGYADERLGKWKRDKDSYYYKAIDRWMAGRKYEEVVPVWISWLAGAVCLSILLLFLVNRALRNQVGRRTKDLRESEKHLRELVESVNSIIIRWDKEGRLLFINKYGLDLFGFREEEILGRHAADTIVPDTDASGRDLHLLIEDILENPENYALHEIENITKSGKRLNIQWTNRAIIDEKGSYSEILSVGTDVTEWRTMENELRQAQKYEAIATLAGGIAHDFNNVLTAIMGYAELAQQGAKQGEAPLAEIQAVVSASYRAKELVQQILNFSRRTPKKRLLVLPSTIVKESLKLLRATLPTSIDLHEEISSGKEKILADPVQIQQIVVNLCTNALHAMKNGHGKLLVKLAPLDLSDDDLENEDFVSGGRFIELMVSDSGHGMDLLTRERIFEPYFTTKADGEGTGMGLAMVQRIVRESGGCIRVDSDEGQGTSFHLYFPVIERVKQDLVTEAVLPGPLPARTERVMVVDDEKTIVEMMRSMLANLGYIVSVFTSSEEALDSFTADPGLVDLIITDQNMPAVTGTELAGKVLKIRPDLPIILCTGYSSVIRKKALDETGIREFIMKPFGAEKLAQVIRNVLDGK